MVSYSSKCLEIIQNCLKLVKKLHPRAPVVRLVIFNFIFRYFIFNFYF